MGGGDRVAGLRRDAGAARVSLRPRRRWQARKVNRDGRARGEADVRPPNNDGATSHADRAALHQTGASPYELIAFATTKSEIRNPDGSVVFSLDNIEVPAAWSQVAADVLAQKYFRKAGVPARLKRVDENGVPSFLWRSIPDDAALEALPKAERYGSETSAKQVFDRLAGAWAYWGWKAGYFDGEEDARAYYDEMRFMLARQIAAPNSPQWFNTGLHWAYGVDGPSQGHYYVDFETGKLTKSKSAYEHPQPHACFIQSVADDLVNEGGIMDLWVREARLFKYGSGTGSNFSALRGENEKLSGGGRSSGLMSFLKIGDRAAGAIKSGGTTRRAAKMVVVDVDHPDIEAYIDWKVKEEQKVAALAAGSKLVKRHLKAILQGLRQLRRLGRRLLQLEKNPALKREVKAARKDDVPDGIISRIIQYARQGYTQSRIRHLRHRLGVGGLSHRLGPELEQFGARHRRLPARGRERRRLDADPAARRQAGEDAESPRPCGRRSATPPGPPPIPASSTTRPSTTGTPARPRGRSAPPTPARNTCSSTTRRAIWPR